MSEWAAKRFWKETTVAEIDGGFAILLDGRQVKTPAKTQVIVPTKALADEIAAEWDAQQEAIDPLSMPFTRTANAALDKVATQHTEVADMLAEYGGSDLTCYRADGPEALVQRQADAWDPLIAWAAETYDARLVPTQGVMFVAQDETALECLKLTVRQFSSFQLAAFHDLVGISGSLLIALAVTRGFESAETLWDTSRVDEKWQEEQWGSDEEATELAEKKKTDFLHAARFWFLVC